MSEINLPGKFKGLFTPARYKAYHGGRGGGKSHSLATGAVLLASQEPKRVLCCREVQRSIRDSVKRLLDDKIRMLGLGPESEGGNGFYESTQAEIRGKNGSLFLFAGLRSNPDSVKSMEGIDIAWVEEANTISQTSLDLLVPTIRKPGSELWFGWNRRNADDPVDKMFLGGEPPPNSIIEQVNYYDNPWFPQVLREEMMWDRSRDIDRYKHIWLGGLCENSESRVFKNWTIDHVEPKEDTVFYYGADWGFSNDPTTVLRMWFLDPKTLVIDREAYKIGCSINNTPALFDQVLHSRQAHVTADSARPEIIAYMNDRNFNIRPAKKGADSVKEGVLFLQSHNIIVHPDCKHMISELTLYSYKVDRLTGQILPELVDDNNHLIDAARYGLESVRRVHRRPQIHSVGMKLFSG